MLGESLAAWLLLPAFVVAVGLGLGLLVERVGGTRMPVLRVPVGICATICITLLVFELGGTGTVALLAVGLMAIAGLVLGRGELRALRPTWLLLAGIATYLLHLAPVLLDGAWTWSGYNFVNDTSVQLLLAEHLAANGTAFPQVDQITTASEHVRIYRITEYPLGAHSLLATADRFVPGPLAAIYQPLIAVLAASTAVVLGSIARRMGLPAAAAATVGLVAAGANLYYQYGLQGNLKEIAFFGALVAAAATGRELLAEERPLRAVPAAAVCFAAAFATFSAAAAPYLLALGAALAAGALLGRRKLSMRRLAVAGAALLGLSLLLALPTLLSAVQFNKIASGTFATAERATDLGHLLRPLELIQAAGIWLTGDYRGPVPGSRAAITTVLCVLVVLLAVAGVVWAVRRREVAGLAVLFATAATAAYLFPRLSPYADGKVIALASPVVLLFAGVGTFALWLRWRMLAAPLAALVVLGIALSDAFAYHVVKLAPVERLEALEDAASRYREAPGLVMLNEPEELAKNFTGDAPLNVATEAVTPRQIELRTPQAFGARYFDLDEHKLSYAQRFPVILKRRSPDASRPPANFRLDYANRWYEAWVRRPGLRVAEHLPLQALHRAAVKPRCADVVRLAARAKPGQFLMAARGPDELRLDLRRGRIRGGWPQHPQVPGRAIPETPGFASGSVRATRAGRYSVWVGGSFGRRVTVSVDGRVAGQASGANNLGQWLPLGSVSVSAGRHRLELHRPGGSLRPGDGYTGEIGPVVLSREAAVGMKRVAPAAARSLCSGAWDWIELVERAPRRG